MRTETERERERERDRPTDRHDKVNSRLCNFAKSPNEESVLPIIVVNFLLWFLILRKITETLVSSVLNVTIIK